MSAALKSYRPRPVPPRRQTATAGAQTSLRRGGSALPAESLPQTPDPSPPVVLPTAPGLGTSPVVRLLSQLNLVSSTLAVAMVGLTLVSYGTSVYINRQLNQTNQKLSRLQRSEQQLTTANEVLKNHIAQQVGTQLEDGKNDETGLHPPQPSSVIFLKPTQRAAPAALPNQVVNRFSLPQVEVPLGY